MQCPSCSNDMILTKATDFGEEYRYCRFCKKELAELIVLETLSVPPPPPSRHPEHFVDEDHDGGPNCRCTDLFMCTACADSLDKAVQAFYPYTP